MKAEGQTVQQRSANDRARTTLRRLEWRLRKRVSTQLGGEHRSVFHGKGMEFDQVVKYNFGDDVRDIDWNVTARLGEPYRKVFVEERDVPLVVTFADDPALRFGSGAHSKRDVLLEMAGLVLLLGTVNRQRVSLIRTGNGENIIHPPSRRRERVLGWLLDLLSAPPPDAAPERRFDALPLPLGSVPRNAIILWLGEIPTVSPPPAWTALRRQHRCIGIRVEDGWEREPAVGLSGTLYDPTTGEAFPAGDSAQMRSAHAAWRARREALWAEWWPDPVDRLVVDTMADPLAALVRLLTQQGSRRPAAGAR